MQQEKVMMMRDPGPKEPLDAILRRLQEDVVTFVKEQLQRIQRLLASDYPECSESEVQSREVLKIALDFLKRMKQDELVQRLQSRSTVGVCRDELKKHMQQKFSRVFEGVAKAGDSAPLTQIYTELYITEGGASEVNQEHEDFDLRKYRASETALLGLLPVVRASTKVLLRDSGLSPHSCGPLASVLSSSSLTHLDLSNNDLQDSGVELLCSGLKSAPCGLHTLRLSGCLISERGGAALASALSPAPSHLRELDLSYNHPGGSSELLKALQDDPHCPLQELRLDPAGEQWMVPGLRKYSCRVCVFLDSEAGSLSFYEVVSDGELFHLHTFTSSFSEPVFPGFRLWSDGCSVSVVDLRRAPPAGLRSEGSSVSVVDLRRAPPAGLRSEGSSVSVVDLRRAPPAGLRSEGSSVSVVDLRRAPPAGLRSEGSSVSVVDLRRAPPAGQYNKNKCSVS
uniref:FISNA domain-containing protein n=1 Tax=Knipowitschia caucasica TaxID=637954 RepID=A0AAV2LSC4_KNICA